MKLDFIPLERLSVSKANMRYAKRAPDVSDILPSVRARGVIVPVLVRPGGDDVATAETFEIVAGSRRFHAALIVAGETGASDPLPCAILDTGDDADAIETSLIENLARLDPDEVTQWETFTRLVKEGRIPAEIAATFGLPDLTVKRVLALGNLLPRIRDLYRNEHIDAGTVRHLTLASKRQQKDWLALYDNPTTYAPTGQSLKAWLFGGQSIKTEHALFDLDTYSGLIVADLFGDGGYFADADQFWAAQNAAIDQRRAAYLEAGWVDAVIVPPGTYFEAWAHERTPKRKGGRVYIDVRASGEVTIHEGYLTRKEARRAERGEAPEPGRRPRRPEITSTMQTYLDLHRHAAVRAALASHPSVALRLMVAHSISGSPLWNVKPEPQSARNEAVIESVELSQGETLFDERRRAVLALLGFSAEQPTVIGGSADSADDGVVGLFLRLLDLPDPAVLDVVAIVIGESLAAGSAAVEAVGLHLGIDMAHYWQADAAFLDLLRDREVLTRILADVAGEAVAAANAAEKGKTVKTIIADYLAGTHGRPKVEHWIPRWMAFPPSAYTERGGVGTVIANARVEAAHRTDDDPDPTAPEGAMLPPAPEPVPLAA